MSFIRKIKKPSGTYYARVESHREGKTVRQKHIEYLGTSPNAREIPVDPSVAGLLAQAILSGTTPPDEMKKLLKKLGIEFAGKLKRLALIYNPPLKKLTLRIE